MDLGLSDTLGSRSLSWGGEVKGVEEIALERYGRWTIGLRSSRAAIAALFKEALTGPPPVDRVRTGPRLHTDALIADRGCDHDK